MIEPNVRIVEVPNPRLEVLKNIIESVKVVLSSLKFVDVASLVKGASAGEGLRNKFLGNIQQCNDIVHMVWCFEDENVIHVDESIDPVRDAGIMNLKLALADLTQAKKKYKRLPKDLRIKKATK